MKKETFMKELEILNWLVSEVEGKKYWIVDGGIYMNEKLEHDIYHDLPIELKEKILDNAKSNLL